MSTSFKLTPMAQRKNRLVTRTNGNMNFRSVSGAEVEVMFFLPVVSPFIAGIFTAASPSPPIVSGQCPVQMYVSAVHEPMLAGDVRSLPREQENCDAGDFRGFRHSCIKRNLGKDLLQLFFGIGK